MISFPAHIDIFVIHTPVSFGCGIDGMARYCRLILKKEPTTQAYFMFQNKRREQLRVLWFDGQGLLLCTKRLSKGTFKYWPKGNSSSCSSLNFFDAQTLISGGNIFEKKHCKIWKKLT